MLNLISAPLSLPRAHLDPIVSSQDILAVLSLAIRRPLCSEVIAILMDEEQRGIGLLSFDEPHSPTSLVHQLIGLCSTPQSPHRSLLQVFVHVSCGNLMISRS